MTITDGLTFIGRNLLWRILAATVQWSLLLDSSVWLWKSGFAPWLIENISLVIPALGLADGPGLMTLLQKLYQLLHRVG